MENVLSEVAKLMGKMESIGMKMDVLKPVLAKGKDLKGVSIRDQSTIIKMAERQWRIGIQRAREEWPTPESIPAKKPCLNKLPTVPIQWPKLGGKCPFGDCDKSFQRRVHG